MSIRNIAGEIDENDQITRNSRSQVSTIASLHSDPRPLSTSNAQVLSHGQGVVVGAHWWLWSVFVSVDRRLTVSVSYRRHAVLHLTFAFTIDTLSTRRLTHMNPRFSPFGCQWFRVSHALIASQVFFRLSVKHLAGDLPAAAAMRVPNYPYVRRSARFLSNPGHSVTIWSSLCDSVVGT